MLRGNRNVVPFVVLLGSIIAATLLLGVTPVNAQRSSSRGRPCYYDRTFTSDGDSYDGPTETCVCEDGRWINCYKNTYDDDDYYIGFDDDDYSPVDDDDDGRQDGLVGNDEDAYGCLASAGYTWCAVLCECLRPWETKCEAKNQDQVFAVCASAADTTLCTCVSSDPAIAAEFTYSPSLQACVPNQVDNCSDQGRGAECCLNGQTIQDGNMWKSLTETCLCLDGHLQDCSRRCRANSAWYNHGDATIVNLPSGTGQELCTCYDGSWTGCHSIFEKDKRACTYENGNTETPHGFKLTGHDQVCDCNDGHWEHCYYQTSKTDNRCLVEVDKNSHYIQHGDKYTSATEICTCYDGEWWHECHPIHDAECGNTAKPTKKPTKRPSPSPTRRPSRKPNRPTRRPTRKPSRRPTPSPIRRPTRFPSPRPTFRPPTRLPTRFPTRPPTRFPTVCRVC